MRYKFRAWDTTLDKMLDMKEIEQAGMNLFALCEGVSIVKLMQFTGLQDRNGNDVYEGDIHSLDGEIGVVEWHDGTYFVIGDCVTRFLYLQYSEEKGEVIGNIHSNPELLEATV